MDENESKTGEVIHVNDKGYGFIKVEGYETNVFFHASGVKHIRFEQLRRGDKVSIGSITQNDQGFTAKDIFLVS